MIKSAKYFHRFEGLVILGKLIVLEGIDGSGKSSQYARICRRLEEDGISYHHIVFPRYNKESSALVRLYLNGNFGSDPDAVNAYTASTFFAVDRFASYRDDWGDEYKKGRLILSDRYTTSNAVHQGSKLPAEQLPEYFSWLSDLEYNRMLLPKPDLVIYLETTLEISVKRMRRRESATGTHADIHEQNISYLEKCLKTAELACDFFGWKRISCLDQYGRERRLGEKNDEIFAEIRKFLGQ